jgi:hypothetical protein
MEDLTKGEMCMPYKNFLSEYYLCVEDAKGAIAIEIQLELFILLSLLYWLVTMPLLLMVQTMVFLTDILLGIGFDNIIVLETVRPGSVLFENMINATLSPFAWGVLFVALAFGLIKKIAKAAGIPKKFKLTRPSGIILSPKYLDYALEKWGKNVGHHQVTRNFGGPPPNAFCTICATRWRSYVNVPCGHMTVCKNCVYIQHDSCNICRAPILLMFPVLYE